MIKYILKLTITLSFTLLLGCEGPSGLEGSDAVITDSLPPVIEWIEPESGTFIDSTVHLKARVTDDQGVLRVSFFVARYEFSGELEDTLNSQYSFTLDLSNWLGGPYPVSARAWDVHRNTTASPDIMITVRH